MRGESVTRLCIRVAPLVQESLSICLVVSECSKLRGRRRLVQLYDAKINIVEVKEVETGE